MFQILTDQQNLSQEQEKNLLKYLVEISSSAPSQFMQEIEAVKQQEKLLSFFSRHWQQSINAILTSLHIQYCLDFMQGKLQGKNGLQILSALCKEKHENKSLQLLKLYQKFSTIEKQLVILKCVSEFATSKCQVEQLSIFVPSFIRLEAFIIQKYLNLKNQPSKHAQDYIENDLIIVKNCERWGSQAMKGMFIRLPIVSNSAPEVYGGLLVCLGDVYAALLEAVREQNLKVDILNGIIQEANNYFFRTYTIKDVREKFIGDLQKNHFENPAKKLLIQEHYTKDMPFHTVAYSYLSLLFLKNPLASQQESLKFLVPALSEILSRPYQFKNQLFGMTNRAFSSGNKVQTAYEWEYPIQLFLFYLWRHEPSQFKTFLEHLQIADRTVLVNSLIVLKKIRIQNLELEKEHYILERCTDAKLWEEKRILILLKAFSFSGKNVRSHQQLGTVLEKHQELFKDSSALKELLMDKVKEAEKDNANIGQKLRELLGKD